MNVRIPIGSSTKFPMGKIPIGTIPMNQTSPDIAVVTLRGGTSSLAFSMKFDSGRGPKFLAGGYTNRS